MSTLKKYDFPSPPAQCLQATIASPPNLPQGCLLDLTNQFNRVSPQRLLHRPSTSSRNHSPKCPPPHHRYSTLFYEKAGGGLSTNMWWADGTLWHILLLVEEKWKEGVSQGCPSISYFYLPCRCQTTSLTPLDIELRKRAHNSPPPHLLLGRVDEVSACISSLEDLQFGCDQFATTRAPLGSLCVCVCVCVCVVRLI